ncbi:thioredoxin-dependent thiol peroxidase [Fulvivirgaceae bacterium PWU4]|uniref:thioredoxin-dependent peroxiredoxin n=1 Tax=Chryseosolibacter histidini TaxID=2782349 RepID=A0AAP2GPR6_9BACT|nr:thioredoxin-dependent thiol peroxidase [Chryseosolibacter histidini]MBT1697732.1 thioredoxin-dependent thiol peroxidase [Chryseosolibacter histidini]
MALQAGDKAPDFTVNDQDGNPVKLSDLKGKKVVLYFYPKDMTPGCTAEACNLRDNYRFMQKQGYEVLGVSTDNEKSHRKFIEKEKLPFRLLADTNKVMHDAYGTWVEKSMYGRKYMGTARVTFVIDENGVIEEIIGKVDTKNHAAQILKNEATAPVKAVVKERPAKKTSAVKKVKKAAPKKVKKASAKAKPARKAAVKRKK